MRDKMSKYFSANSTRRYIDVLDALTDQYNNTVHSSTRMTPVEASLKRNKIKVWMNLYPNLSTTEDNAPKFSVGDKARITKKKTTFEKGYTPRWTEEVLTISKIQYTDPPTYKLLITMERKYKAHFTSKNYKRRDKKYIELKG